MITIVSGLPRSGTSMMMRILEAGGLPVLIDGARPADADNPNGYYEFEPVRHTRDDHSWLALADGKAVKMIYKLLFDLPANRTYRVIFMQRALKEVVASQNRMLARRGYLDSGCTDVHALVDAFATEMAITKMWLNKQSCFDVRYVNFNLLLASPCQHLTALAAFLGDGLDVSAMCAVIRTLHPSTPEP
jgi:hypothetical protein